MVKSIPQGRVPLEPPDHPFLRRFDAAQDQPRNVNHLFACFVEQEQAPETVVESVAAVVAEALTADEPDDFFVVWHRWLREHRDEAIDLARQLAVAAGLVP